jgi:hypothetical protein
VDATLFRWDRAVREHGEHLRAHAVERGTEICEDTRRSAALGAEESEQHVLGADVVVAELERLAEGVLDVLARGVNASVPTLDDAPRGASRSIAWRTAESRMSSAWSVWAATPCPSCTMPSSRCSVPIALWFRRRASSCARTTTRRARSVNFSNT